MAEPISSFSHKCSLPLMKDFFTKLESVPASFIARFLKTNRASSLTVFFN